MNVGLKYAVTTAETAFKKSFPYRAFAKKAGFEFGKVDAKNFFNLPITEKQNLIDFFALKKIVSLKKMPAAAYASSGSSGRPTFWFRNVKQETIGGQVHEKIFRDVFKISKNEKTLAVICFSMGVWVAGGYTAACCRWLAEKKRYNLSTITPGLEMGDTIHILKKLAPNFTTVVLAGYPSFLMDVLIKAKAEKISLPKRTKILTAGDSFSEEWRSSVLNMVKSQKPSDVLSIYGSADAMEMGFETNYTIAIRKLMQKNKKKFYSMLGNFEKLPAVFQYDPTTIFFENYGNHLLLTKDTFVPLVRYNLKDIGKALDFAAMEKFLNEKNLTIPKTNTKNLNLPFVIKTGRADVAVTFYALNIYPENIQTGLAHKSVKTMLSGNFKAYTELTKQNQNELLYIEVELKASAKPSLKIKQDVEKSLLTALLNTNIEYKKLYGTLREKALPKISLVKALNSFSKDATKILVSIQGKKPRMYLKNE